MFFTIKLKKVVPRPRVELGKTDYKSVIIPFNYRGNIQSALLKISSLIIKICCMHFKKAFGTSGQTCTGTLKMRKGF